MSEMNERDGDPRQETFDAKGLRNHLGLTEAEHVMCCQPDVDFNAMDMRVYDWRRFVLPEIQKAWPRLRASAKLAIYFTARAEGNKLRR